MSIWRSAVWRCFGCSIVMGCEFVSRTSADRYVSESNRARVFFLAQKPNKVLFQAGLLCSISITVFCHLACQDLKPLQQILPSCWNALNKTPVSTWLHHERTIEESKRFHCLGNLVVPAQAQLAFPILLQMFNAASSSFNTKCAADVASSCVLTLLELFRPCWKLDAF